MSGQLTPAALAARDRAAHDAKQRIRNDRARASERVQKLLEQIESNLFEPWLNVDTLKRACGYRDHSVSLIFHQETQQTPKHYMTSRRLETASKLLRETDLKIWKIAILVGYSSLGSFSKAFFRWQGQRPALFRHQWGDSPSLMHIPSPELCRKALAGRLDAQEAQLLLRRLHELYPQFSSSPQSPARRDNSPDPCCEAATL